MSKIVRVFVPLDSQDESSWSAALQCIETINTSAKPAVTDVVLALHVKDILNHSSLGGFLGKSQSKLLKEGKSLRLPSGATLRLETKRTLSRSFARPTTVIAFYGDDTILEMIDGIRNVAGVVAVPDLPGDGDEWKARWSPIIPGQPASAQPELIKDPVVVAALTDLSGWINKSNGVLIARDKQSADEVLRILRARGHTAQPKDVKSWAIRAGWSVGAANDLGALAGKIFALTAKPALGKIYNADERYNRWKPT